MQASEMIGLMKRQVPFDEKTLVDLQNLLEEYPYFQAAQVLYTLNLQTNKDSRFNVELRKTACSVSDRRKLFYLLEKDSFPAHILEHPEKKELPASSSFDLIDFFLAQKEEQEPKRKKESENPHSQIVSTDYISYFLSAPTASQAAEVKPLQHQQAIDRFLEQNEQSPVKIELRENGEEDPVENHFLDLDSTDTSSFFSETLAKIYLKQKKYDKALEIIRKLNLLYPEKNRYFADQIRFLELLIINIKK